MTRIYYGSVACEFGLTFFQECVDAFVAVVRFETTQLRFGLVAKHLLELSGVAHVDRMLSCRECDWRRGLQTLGELQCRTLQIFRRHNLVHDSKSQSFISVD